jgi:hypothetical protein
MGPFFFIDTQIGSQTDNNNNNNKDLLPHILSIIQNRPFKGTVRPDCICMRVVSLESRQTQSYRMRSFAGHYVIKKSHGTF